MKQYIVSLTALVISGFLFLSCKESIAANSMETTQSESSSTADNVPVNKNFHYELGSRFINHVTKEKLETATTIEDIVPEGATDDISSFWDVKIGLVKDKTVFAKGENNHLNESQLTLLSHFSYSTDYYVEAFCKRLNHKTGEFEKQCFVYYVTVIPEQQATFEGGNDALLAYLKKNSREEVSAVKNTSLKPGKIRFNVSNQGVVEGIQLEASCGNHDIDATLLELMKNAPQKWKAATDSAGETIDQELVFSFGVVGC